MHVEKGDPKGAALQLQHADAKMSLNKTSPSPSLPLYSPSFESLMLKKEKNPKNRGSIQVKNNNDR
jgi:hypothetical protein